VGCPGQLTRTTTIPHGPLDILQVQEQVRHRGGDRRAHRGSNPGRGRNKSHDWPQQLDPQVPTLMFLMYSIIVFFIIYSVGLSICAWTNIIEIEEFVWLEWRHKRSHQVMMSLLYKYGNDSSNHVNLTLMSCINLMLSLTRISNGLLLYLYYWRKVIFKLILFFYI
jgi:hypothetical protein